MKCDVCGTKYIAEATTNPVPAALASYDASGKVYLTKTGHTIDPPVPGEGLGFYYGRIASQVGGDPNLAGAIMLMGDTYRIGNTGDPLLDLAVQVDAFANAAAYGIGAAGAPPVAAGPGSPSAPVPPSPLNGGTLEPNGVNTPWIASDPGQVQFIRVKGDGTYSVVCDNVVPVYVGVGFYPGVATYADLATGGVRGTQTAEVAVKDGDYFCYAHAGVPGNRMRASGRK